MSIYYLSFQNLASENNNNNKHERLPNPDDAQHHDAELPLGFSSRRVGKTKKPCVTSRAVSSPVRPCPPSSSRARQPLFAPGLLASQWVSVDFTQQKLGFFLTIAFDFYFYDANAPFVITKTKGDSFMSLYGHPVFLQFWWEWGLGGHLISIIAILDWNASLYDRLRPRCPCSAWHSTTFSLKRGCCKMMAFLDLLFCFLPIWVSFLH